LQNLPPSTAAAVNELASYDWQSSAAREAYEQIKDLLGREVLEQRFAGMKQALESATDEDREAVSAMLRDLNELLGKHRRGEDTEADFQEFMARHGQYFPENPQSVEELVDALAQRAAAAQRLLQSMSPEQRDELMRLSAQAFGSPELMAQLSELDAALQALRPGEDWNGSERFEGQEGLGLGDGTGVLQDIAELDELSEQLSQSYNGSRLDDLDLDALARQLGENAAVSARTLAGIERAMQDGGYLRRGADGDLRLSPQAMRRLGKSLLRDAARQLSGRQGSRDTRMAGAAGELTGSSRQWEFGDAEPWDVTRTMTNAIRRTMADGGDPARGLRLAVDDIEVAETEARTQAAVALLVDVSFSMAAEGRWVPMKRTALALHHLVSTRFRGDRLQLITFGRYAQSMDIGELTALPALREQGTNLHHGLLLAARFFRQHPSMQPVLLVVTDGEPTAHLLPDGDSWFNWPPDAETIRATVGELDRLGRMGAQTTFFRLGNDPGLERFIQRMAHRVDGRVVAPEVGDLGAAVVGEYLRAHVRSASADGDWF
ncbi:MAG: vWA domain-containing protein, partial [Arthrobacter sp.]